ncbi:hypothetical protein PVAG01_04605 [Phlyctema vagabunda]|uniref:F-box domain-containing protein n=1 Tax=Phlyctema vagabunda TaxID=108571 RepID=A0ABR4PHZ1_9HELO
MELTIQDAGHSLSSSMGSPSTFDFLQLPVVIMVQFPIYLRDIKDLINLSASCSYLHELYKSTAPNTIYQLAAASPSLFYQQPSPHFLVAAVARQVGEWALETPKRRFIFHNAFRTNGIEGLFDLCKRVGGLSMKELRELHDIQESVLRPIAFEISKECGPLSTLDPARVESDQGVELVICEDPYKSLLQIIMFGDFFAANIRAVYDPQVTDPFSASIRRDWWANCCPDVNCAESPVAAPIAGPLCSLEMMSLHNVFCSEVWRGGWARAVGRLTEKLSPDLQPHDASLFQTQETLPQLKLEKLKEGIWEQTIKGQGLRGMHLLLYGGIANIPNDFIETRKKIMALDVSHIDTTDNKRSDEAWAYRVSARSDVYSCLDWL